MALIQCPECGKEVSEKAMTCPNCGCPIAVAKDSKVVRVKLPNNVADGFAQLLSSKKCTISANGSVIWSGLQGENAKFEIDQQTTITIDIGSMGNPIKGVVEPGKKYNCIQDMGLHWKATYRLTEVDYIDAD